MIPKIAKIENHPDLVKDMESKAVLNTNYAALLEHKKKQRMVEDIDNLKKDMGEIKDSLKTLLSLLNK